MRGGGGDILLYYNPTIDEPNKCIIIKKKRLGFRDDLYLFFHKDIKPDDIQKFVRRAMGLADDVSFTPEFKPQNSSDAKYKLNDLFIKLSGRLISYSTIESGYLQRDEKNKDKEVVTSTKHKITPETSAPSIKKWEDVMSILGFSENEPFQNTYTVLSSYVAERGHSFITISIDTAQTKEKRRLQSDCYTIISDSGVININDKNTIEKLKVKLREYSKHISDIAMSYNATFTNKTVSKFIRDTYLPLGSEYTHVMYETHVRELNKIIENIKNSEEYKKLPSHCQKFLDSNELTMFNTIDEIVRLARSGS
jgi:hypothetical protein